MSLHPQHQHQQHPQHPHSGMSGMERDIAKAIDGEYSAIICYEHLARLAPTEEVRNRIIEIRGDEIRHYHTFTHLYTSLTGRSHTPHQSEACPATYREGLLAAIKDEQMTVDSYNEIADKTTIPSVREAFRRAALDEQNHAVWFLLFWTER